MNTTIKQTIIGFLSDTESLVNRVNELPYATAIELYDLLDVAAKSVTENIKTLNAELRAEICTRQDIILERIIDLISIEKEFIGKPTGIYTPAVQGYRRWTNTELLKDKCLTGYMLSKVIDSKSIMYFCTNPSDYPYLTSLPDLDILYHNVPSGTPDIYYEHLENEYHKMDVLILHGMYEQTIDFLNAYRTFRPDGKVYCGLDMNSYWMSNINWEHPKAKRFAKQCDIIATSCTSLRDLLNKNPNVNFPCRWLPNGFYNSGNNIVKADPDNKKNVILTVGRIGTAQKNNQELLIAFAKISNVLQGWTLRLVGNINNDFQPFINQYFSQRPDLKKRVIFTGAIVNKDELYNEYAKAKVFALTSQFEGGTPNVYAEALFHGCMFVTSDIDAADDITGHNSLGIKYNRGDVDALASALIKLSRKSRRSAFQEHIPKALEYAHKYFDWYRNSKKLAYMLFKTKD